MKEVKGTYGSAKIFTDIVEKEAEDQVVKMLSHEITKGTKVRMMPDIHAGKGATIGTTIKLPESFEDWKVCPNVVGSDVGCGMMFYKLANKNVDLIKLDKVVNTKVPSGYAVHEKPKMEETIRELISKLSFKLGEKAEERIVHSLGTLGGGNHFIELGVDEEGFYWLAVHSGSRNLGTQVAGVHQEIAMKLLEENQDKSKEIIEQLKREGRHREISQVLKEYKENHKAITKEDLDLAFLSGDLLKNYLSDMVLAQKFAELSRMTMLNIIADEMKFSVIDKFDSVHNFIEHDNFTNGVIRKGATSAKDGERLVIPLNMRDGSIICIGRGNEDWNESAPHGAGRIMSRSKASRELKMEDFKTQMKGIYSSSIMESTLDEAPEAYKPAQSILDNIKDTADVLHLVKPVYNFKAHEEKKEWKK